jgi:hypothetical protein
LAMNGEPAPAEPTDEMIVAALHASAIDTNPSIYGFPELQVSATNVPGIRAVYMKIAAAMQASTPGESKCTCPSGDGSLRWPCDVHPPAAQASTSGERQEGGAA